MLRLIRPTLLGLLMAGITLVLGISTAMATSIDFIDGSWSGANGNSSFDHASGVRLSSIGGNITVNNTGSNLGDGLGIGNDEITQGGVEQLTISFLNGPVTLETVNITDLYRLDFGSIFNRQNEVGWYSINGGTPSNFTAVALPVLTNGELTLNLNTADVNTITFWANNDSGSDYSVRGLTYNSVPEPSTLLLLGCGFVLLAILHRRGFFPSV